MFLIQTQRGDFVHSLHPSKALVRTPPIFAERAMSFDTVEKAEKWRTKNIKKCKDLASCVVVTLE